MGSDGGRVGRLGLLELGATGLRGGDSATINGGVVVHEADAGRDRVLISDIGDNGVPISSIACANGDK